MPPWTGSMTVEMANLRGWSVEPARLDVGAHDVTVWHGARRIGVMVREEFRQWLSMPARPYEAGHSTWSRGHGHMCIAYGTAFFTVAPNAVDDLNSKI
jgi:hypothetical protein